MCTRVPLLPASMIAIVRSGISLSLSGIFFKEKPKNRNVRVVEKPKIFKNVKKKI